MTRSKTQYLRNQAVIFEHPRDLVWSVWQYADNDKTQEECHLEKWTVGLYFIKGQTEMLMKLQLKYGWLGRKALGG